MQYSCTLFTTVFLFCFLRQDAKRFLANDIRRFNVSAFQVFLGGIFVSNSYIYNITSVS